MSAPDHYDATILGIGRSLVRNRGLISELVKREVLGRYRGSLVGIAWSLFNPVLMLAVYTFFFSVVFKARWGVGPTESSWDFALILFVGLIIHGFFAECITRGPTLVTGNVSYVKKVVFPLEILAWVAVGSALFHAMVSVVVLVMAMLLLGKPWNLTMIFFPLILVPFVLLTIGVIWCLAGTGVYVRDISQMTGILSSVLMFTSPIFFPISALPLKYQSLVMLNPLTLVIEQARKVLVFGQVPDWSAIFLYALLGIGIAWVGFWWFQRIRKGFADVL